MEKAIVTQKGVFCDRRFVVVSETGKFLTGRGHPALVLLSAQLENGVLRISSPIGNALTVKVDALNEDLEGVEIWGDQIMAKDMGAEAATWISSYLGKRCRIYGITPKSTRIGKYKYTPKGFADAAPLLLTTSSSLESINDKLTQPVPHLQFRPNIVIAADSPEELAPFEEDYWSIIKINGIELDVAWGCSRCVFTSVDPDTGTKDPAREVVKALRASRTAPDGQFYFGQNIIPLLEKGQTGEISLGDKVEIISRRKDRLYQADGLK